MTWLNARWLAFDTETTGVSTSEDRIVTAHASLVGGGKPAEPFDWLIDPGIEIPAGATAIHGITTAHARENGQDPRQAVGDIATLIRLQMAAGVPVVGWNVVYDLSILAAELDRHGLAPLGDVRPVLDGLVLDKHVDTYRKGSRKLTAVAQHYGLAFDDSTAHSAEADALAAARTVWHIAKRHGLGAMTLDEVHDLQVRAAAEQQASLEAYFRRTKPEAVVERGWPVR